MDQSSDLRAWEPRYPHVALPPELCILECSGANCGSTVFSSDFILQYSTAVLAACLVQLSRIFVGIFLRHLEMIGRSLSLACESHTAASGRRCLA